MKYPLNLIGLQFSRLHVVARAGSDAHRKSLWLCECSCGKSHTVIRASLVSGASRSCGCFQTESASIMGKRRKTHGRTGAPEYRSWQHMKDRCYNDACEDYKYHGARGITVCAEWRNSFEAFYRDMGPRPSPELTLERKDNDGNYEPNNCIWDTRTAQSRNRRFVVMSPELASDLRMATQRGESMCSWARSHGISYGTASCAERGITWKEV